MAGRKYSDAQWAKAAKLRAKGKHPPEIERLTGISRASLYTRHRTHPEWKPWGINKVRPDRLEAMRRDFEAGMSKANWSAKHKAHPTRMYQLAREKGWRMLQRPGRQRERMEANPTPVWRRCCGCKMPAVNNCPSCGSQGFVNEEVYDG